MDQTEFKNILLEQDRLISACGVEVWVGMEPTFTRRFANPAQWLSEALGDEKLTYAYMLLNEVYQRQPGGIVLHTLGRQYGGEALARWSIGYYQARHGQFVWDTPGDPCLDIMGPLLPAQDAATRDLSAVGTSELERFWEALTQGLNQTAWTATAFKVDIELGHRILFRSDNRAPLVDVDENSHLARPSVHAQKIPHDGLTDDLALQGDFLLCLGWRTVTVSQHQRDCVVIELPAIGDVDVFIRLLRCIAESAKQAGVDNVYLQGFPPPVDDSVSWTTITPDPAVIEINQAPASNAADFFDIAALYYGAADKVGLCPYRLHYNGVVSDSGGGGQFTLGGAQPLSSPFFRYPRLLPRLVRYVNAHPAFSYWFAPPSIGSSSQSPRCDEGVSESFNELSLALDQLEVSDSPDPGFIWRSLNPFLVDPSGNPHRSELNIEKLWNPYLPGRGCLGLVEFRAFRMSRSPQCAAAIAVLLRSVVTMLCRENKTPELVAHGSRLHDEYALPLFLRQDLLQVFNDLEDCGLQLHDEIKRILLQEPVRHIGRAEFHGCIVELEQALEFWPLIGDVASQEHGGSRLVDASTTRLQITLRSASHHPSQLDGWEVWVEGYRAPLSQVQDQHGPVKVCALRYRHFMPDFGLHPGIAARNNITFVLTHRGLSDALQVRYFEWHPQGLAYPGLPQDLEDAAQRRAQRFVAQVISLKDCEPVKEPDKAALTPYCLDLRRLL